MFQKTSRYYGLEIATQTEAEPDGSPREVRYVRRRFIPSTDATTLVEHIVAPGDRLDNVTARYLGDPTQFWRVCDANQALHPEELTAEVGAHIKITLPNP